MYINKYYKMGFEVRRIFQNSIFLFLLSFSLFGQLPVKKSGKIFGILTAKGEAWIQIKEDGGLASRYLAPWEGSSPSRGVVLIRNSLGL